MRKSLDLARKYWSVVFKKAFRIAEEKTGTKGLIYATLLSVLVALVAFLLGFFNVIPEDTPYIGEAINNAWVQLGTGIVGLGVLAIALVFSLLYVPTTLFEEQGGFLENPFDLVVIPRDSDIESGNQVWASIEVHNIDKQKSIDNCYIRLDQVIEVNSKHNLLENRQNLTWSAREHSPTQSGNQPIQITAQDFRVCDIAKTVRAHEKIEFTMWFGTLVIGPGKYELEIRAYGNWREHPINYPYSFILEYHGQNKLFLRKKT
jgi:hypothetical protein